MNNMQRIKSDFWDQWELVKKQNQKSKKSKILNNQKVTNIVKKSNPLVSQNDSIK
jgi:hypothetical protein